MARRSKGKDGLLRRLGAREEIPLERAFRQGQPASGLFISRKGHEDGRSESR